LLHAVVDRAARRRRVERRLGERGQRLDARRVIALVAAADERFAETNRRS
jgi:hypothetical protein